MQEQYISNRNAYSVDINDPGVAMLGYGKKIKLFFRLFSFCNFCLYCTVLYCTSQTNYMGLWPSGKGKGI